jgi:hypothetical protein
MIEDIKRVIETTIITAMILVTIILVSQDPLLMMTEVEDAAIRHLILVLVHALLVPIQEIFVVNRVRVRRIVISLLLLVSPLLI